MLFKFDLYGFGRQESMEKRDNKNFETLVSILTACPKSVKDNVYGWYIWANGTMRLVDEKWNNNDYWIIWGITRHCNFGHFGILCDYRTLSKDIVVDAGYYFHYAGFISRIW